MYREKMNSRKSLHYVSRHSIRRRMVNGDKYFDYSELGGKSFCESIEIVKPAIKACEQKK